jgi:hypothetical protein
LRSTRLGNKLERLNAAGSRGSPCPAGLLKTIAQGWWHGLAARRTQCNMRRCGSPLYLSGVFACVRTLQPLKFRELSLAQPVEHLISQEFKHAISLVHG